MLYRSESNCIYLLGETGKKLAEVTFPSVSENVVDINHTYVDESLRGQGIAEHLMSEAAAKIRSENKKAKLTCSYAKRWFSLHKEFSDILV